MNYQEALEHIKEDIHYISTNESIDKLQELIDKTTICGLPMEEAIRVITMYKDLKDKTNKLDDITDDLMMVAHGRATWIKKESEQQ